MKQPVLGNGFIARIALSGVLSVGLFAVTAGPALASPDNACEQRLESARGRLDKDVARHGDNSSQARHDRDRLEDARRWCRDRHQDWDHDKYDRDDHRDNDRHEYNEHHDDNEHH